MVGERLSGWVGWSDSVRSGVQFPYVSNRRFSSGIREFHQDYEILSEEYESDLSIVVASTFAVRTRKPARVGRARGE